MKLQSFTVTKAELIYFLNGRCSIGNAVNLPDETYTLKGTAVEEEKCEASDDECKEDLHGECYNCGRNMLNPKPQENNIHCIFGTPKTKEEKPQNEKSLCSWDCDGRCCKDKPQPIENMEVKYIDSEGVYITNKFNQLLRAINDMRK